MRLIPKHLLTLTLLLSAAWATAVADNNKLSISTQMFLEEFQGDLDFDATPATRVNAPGQPRLLKAVDRPYVSPDTIDGKVYISTFVYVTTDEDIRLMEALGVIVETRFVNRPLEFRKIVQPVLIRLQPQECLIAALVQYALENVSEFGLSVDCGS